MLKYEKNIRDSINGNLPLTELELNIMDYPQFQRLRRVKQLGFTSLIYPGANHSRFEHCIGTQISACINISYIEDFGCGKEYYSHNRHSAYEDIDDIALCKELLDGICISVFLADDFRIRISGSGFFLGLN